MAAAPAIIRASETLPNGRSYDIVDMDPAGPYDTTDIYTVPRRPFLRDGRQSRS